jgi:hypothetical protein
VLVCVCVGSRTEQYHYVCQYEVKGENKCREGDKCMSLCVRHGTGMHMDHYPRPASSAYTINLRSSSGISLLIQCQEAQQPAVNIPPGTCVGNWVGRT